MHHNIPLGIVSAQAAAYLLEQSLLFDGAAYLSRTPSVAGNRKTWTFSCWHKRGRISSYALFSAASDTNNRTSIQFGGTHNLQFVYRVAASNTVQVETTAVFRDPNAWYHIVVVYDSTDATANERVKIYVNGTRVDNSYTAAASLNLDTDINSTDPHELGAISVASNYEDGLMAFPILVDGAALDPTSFGEEDADGYWNPIEFTGVTTLDYINPAITAFIGNMTGNGGLSAISDGSRTYTANTALSANGVTANAFAGVDWGVGVTKTPIRIVVQNGLVSTVGPSWDGNNSGTINMAIYGSNSAPASYNDGTLLGSKTGITNTNNANLQEVFEGGDLTTTTGYRYHWVHLYASATEQVIGEVQFFAESATPGYGTNGGAYDFAINTAYGTDVSGNGNNFTDNGFATTDQLADTPTDDATLDIGNHVRFTPLGRFTDITLSEANTVMTNASGNVRNCELSIAPESGKFIFEINAGTGNNNGMAFARDTYDRASNANWGNSLDAIRMFRESSTNLRTYYNTGSGVNVNIGVTIDNTNDRIVYAIDADNRYLWLGLWDASASAYIWLDGSGGVTGAPATGTNPTYTLPGTGAIYIAGETISGQPITLYAAADKWLGSGVTGFVALATQNFPAPTIADGSEYFNTVLWTGNGTTQSITGVGFQPDFAWIKCRSVGSTGHALFDSIRGVGNGLYSNATNAEITDASSLTSFGTDGVSFGGSNATFTLNNDTVSFVGWFWKAGGAAVSNTDGSITSSVSANPTSGFSIATYAGNSTAGATIGHGLASVPKFAIFKRRDTTGNWLTYHHSIGNTDALFLNLTNAKAASVQYFNNTNPTSSLMTFGINGDVNQTGFNYVGYLWAEVEGFSKFGSYTGNGSADGPFVYTGFKPAFVMLKRTDGAASWVIMDNKRDTYNPANSPLIAEGSNAEGAAAGDEDFLSNGFKIRTTSTNYNASGGTYIYAAFAEVPFQGDDGYTQARAR